MSHEGVGCCELRNEKADERGDEGRVGLLVVVCVAVLFVFVLVSANATAVAVEHRRLLACADRVSSWVAGSVDGLVFYSSGEDLRLAVSEQWGKARAEQAVERMRASTCDVGAGVVLTGVVVEESDITVTVAARTKLPMTPTILADVVAPQMSASSSAKLAREQ